MISTIEHPFNPIFDRNSRVLILGTMPSPKSREVNFYYGHSQNRFWKIMQRLFNEEPLLSIEKKRNFLVQHHIALWDVFSSCDIDGASDSSIRKAVPNDLSRIFDESAIRVVILNGKTAYNAYRRFFSDSVSVPFYGLPSTSPANCRGWTLEKLTDAYRVILDYV